MYIKIYELCKQNVLFINCVCFGLKTCTATWNLSAATSNTNSFVTITVSTYFIRKRLNEPLCNLQTKIEFTNWTKPMHTKGSLHGPDCLFCWPRCGTTEVPSVSAIYMKKTELQSPLRVKTRLIEPRQWQCKETCILYADVSSKNCGRRNIIGTPVLSSVFFAQNNFTVVISMQKVRVQKISLIWSCQVLNHLTKLFPIKIKTLFQKPWKPYVP